MDYKSKFSKKAVRKQKRIKSQLKKHGVESVDYPTNCLLVGNGGLVCSVQRETLMELFSCHGIVQNILMIPEKSYAYVVYQDKESAIKAMDHIHGHKLNTENFDATLYLCYIEASAVPNKIECSIGKYPPGLVLLEDFVTEEEEDKLLSVVNCEQTGECTLKHRKVKHFGYEFNYGTNNVNKSNPLEERIPEICYPQLQKLKALGYISKLPDQLTVNTYIPGQGIAPHVDTHSAFEDGIVSLSLGSQITMDFYHPEGEHIAVLLPRRSILIMTGESRYLWRHGITPRKTDVISVSNEGGNHLTLVHRLQRTSFTFRIVRQGNCNCAYKEQCDTQKDYCRPKPPLVVAETEARKLEKQYVYQVYEEIADHFSDTRHKPWPCVANFLSTLSTGSVLVDVGCGNGKYLGRNNHVFEVGCDFSVKLIHICCKRGVEVIASDCLNLPLRDDFADACICIAVIHHMSTEERRRGAVEEIVRILKPGGKALVYVWALEQEGPEGPSNYLSFSKIAKKSQQYNDTKDLSTVAQEKLNVSETVQNCNEKPTTGSVSSQPQANAISLKKELESFMNIPIHKNRTHFEHQDVLVPWHKKEKIKLNYRANQEGDNEQVFHRYYHVFTKGELERLITSVNNVYIQSSYYDKGNWCVLFEKL